MENRTQTRLLIAIICCFVVTISFGKPNFESPKRLNKAYVQLTLKRKVLSAFYKVSMSSDEIPYIRPISLFNILGFQSHCIQSSQICLLTIQPNNYKFWIDFNKLTYGDIIKNRYITKGHFDADEFSILNGQLFVNYNLLSKWLPMKIIWDIDDYEITIEPKFQTLSAFKQQHTRTIQQAKAHARQSKRLMSLPVQKPTDKFSSELMLTLTTSLDNKGHTTEAFQLNNSTDIFDGNLDIIYDANYDNKLSSQAPQWNYTRPNASATHEFELGKVFVDNNSSLLMSSLSLTNAVAYLRMSNLQAAGEFIYHGLTTAGTEIDVWRNGVLRSTQKIATSGPYTIRDDSAQEGDVYILQLYYKNGSTAQKKIIVSQGQAGLLKAHQLDMTGASGYIDHYGQYSYVTAGYGVSKQLSIDLSGFKFPLKENDGIAAGSEVTYQPINWLTLDYQNLLYAQTETDQAVRANLTYWSAQNIDIVLRSIQHNSPIRQLGENPAELLFLTLPFTVPAEDDASRWLILNDDFNIKDYSILANYELTNVFQNLTVQQSKQVTGWLDLTLQEGAYQENHQSMSPWAGYEVTLTPSDNSNISLQQDYVLNHPDLNAWSASYSYYKLNGNMQDYSLTASIEKSGDNPIEWSIQGRKQIIPQINIGLTASTNEILLSLNLSQVLGTSPHSNDPNQFSTGTLYGKVDAPQSIGHTEQPLSNVIVKAAGQAVKTDQKGRYKLSGLPTYTPIIVSFDTNTFPASLIPKDANRVLEFRPATAFKIDPTILSTAGIYGEIDHTHYKIPMTDRIDVINEKTHQIEKIVRIEPDTGFFMIKGLSPGNYELKLTDQPGPKPLHVRINTDGKWIDDIHWEWH